MDRPAKRTPSKVHNRYRLAIVACILTTSSVLLINSERRAPSISLADVSTGRVVRGDMTVEVRGSGSIVPRFDRLVSVSTSARVDQLLVDPGATDC